MSLYCDMKGASSADWREKLALDGRRTGRAVRKALERLGSSDGQLTAVVALEGFDQASALSTAARYGAIGSSWAFTYDAVRQAAKSDPRIKFCFLRFALSDGNVDPGRPHDLAAFKRELQSQLKRRYDSYIARFTVMPGESGPMVVVSVIAMVTGVAKQTERRTRGLAKGRKLMEPSMQLEASSDVDDLPVMVAEFCTPTGDKRPRDVEDGDLIRFLIYGGLLRTDRSWFGHGMGKKMARKIVAQLIARAAADDILDRSPLPPEALVPLLAGLPIDDDATPAGLPPLKLP